MLDAIDRMEFGGLISDVRVGERWESNPVPELPRLRA